MALAIPPNLINHSLRLNLLELGLLPDDNELNHYLQLAEQRLTQQLISSSRTLKLLPDNTHAINCHDFLHQLEMHQRQNHQASRFWLWQSLAQQIEQQKHCLALRLIYQAQWQHRLQLPNAQSFYDWLQSALPPHKQLHFFEQWSANSAIAAIEQLLTQLAHQQTSHKDIVFNTTEQLQYAGEYQAGFKLQWLAIGKTLLQANSNYLQLVNTHFPREMALWQEHLLQKQCNHNHYLPLAVHPLYWEKKIRPHFIEAINEKRIIPLKLRHDVYPTKHMGQLLSQSACAPLLAVSLFDQDHNRLSADGAYYLNHLCKALPYQFSASLSQCQLKPATGHQLACQLIKHPALNLAPAETVLPIAALFMPSPNSETPLLLDIIKASGMEKSAYFDLYMRVCNQPVFSLIEKHQLYLQSQPLDDWLVLSQHRPKRLIQRTIKRCHYVGSIDNALASLAHQQHKARTDLQQLALQQTQQTHQRLWSKINR